MRSYPALDVSWPSHPGEDTIELLLAAVDEAGPTAVEPQAAGVRVFFPDEASRDAASRIVSAAFPAADAASLLVPDENWAERSQADLTAVRIGRIVVAPPWALAEANAAAGADDIVLSVQPSMGFGTGHHQSTRLCLWLLQEHVSKRTSVLDIGTGSGVLAIAARRLGATRVLAVDYDPDALQAARENVDGNGAGAVVELRPFDLASDERLPGGPFDVVCANITAAVLVRHAPAIAAEVGPLGTLVASGFQAPDADEVAAAFAPHGLQRIGEAAEDDWLALALRRASLA